MEENKVIEIRLDSDLINKIKTEKDEKELELYCQIIRDKIIEVCSINGGHLSSNLGIVEIVVSLFRKFDFINDDILFDVGHQTYAFKLLTERNLITLRKENGIHAFQSLGESLADKMSAGHSSTSLSIGYAFSKYKMLNNIDSKTIVVIGDASFSSGLSFEALNQIAADKDLKNLIILINDNGMSISKRKDAISNHWSKFRNSKSYVKASNNFKKVFNKYAVTRWFYRMCKHIKDGFKRLVLKDNLFEALGLIYIGPIDGHDIDDLELAFSRCIKNNKTTVVHCLTTKGKGLEVAENDEIGTYHGVTPFNIETMESIDVDSNKISLTKLTGELIYEYMKQNQDCYVINPSMIYGSSLVEVFNDFKDRTFDVGISEEHAVTFASGLALKNSKVIVSIYSTFLQRAYDEIIHDVSRMNLPVLFVLDKCGLVGEDGETHQGIYDVAFLNSIPNVKVVMPYDYKSLKYSLDGHYFETKTPLFVRISKTNLSVDELNKEKEKCDNLCDAKLFVEDKLQIKEHDTLLIGIGFDGKELLNKIENVDKLMLRNLTLSKEELLQLVPHILEYKNIILVDKYSIYEGTSSILNKHLRDLDYKNNYKYFCIDKVFVKQGTINEQLMNLKLDDNSLINEIKKIINV